MECTRASRARPATPWSSRAAACNGRLIVAADHFDLDAKLGFLLGAFSKRIESAIRENLEQPLARHAGKHGAAKLQEKLSVDAVGPGGPAAPRARAGPPARRGPQG
ncbi:MAG: polyhydroxyalkanoic acid system family protein [Comamonadaceae bacterium]|nr:polyhydroxyalkanoic acid system family protein [Comamonadaceae bacterium]